jgi:hypothetical protein
MIEKGNDNDEYEKSVGIDIGARKTIIVSDFFVKYGSTIFAVISLQMGRMKTHAHG